MTDPHDIARDMAAEILDRPDFFEVTRSGGDYFVDDISTAGMMLLERYLKKAFEAGRASK